MPEGIWKVGKPRLRWLEGVENDFSEYENKWWIQKENNTEEWASVVKEVKAVTGQYNQEVSK
jgi:hypothetical protein